MNVCPPVGSPEYVFGDEQAIAVAPSRLQVVRVTHFDVFQANRALVELVDPLGCSVK
jgi:hypothetical protein